MRRIKHAFGLSALAFTLAQAASAAQFSNVIIFGDSLSDSGQYGARFTTNPGTVTLEYVARYFGYTVRPSTQGGTNFAYGGARVTRQDTFNPQATPVTGQITSFLSAGNVDPNALYSVLIGANDIQYQLGLAAAGMATSAQVQAALTQAATDELVQIARLRAAGARYILVFNLPDLARTPLGASQPTAPLTALTNLYNTTFSVGLASFGFDVIPINTFAFTNEVLANGAAYGFTNTTVPACTVPLSLNCTPSTLRDPNAPNTYFFADGIHPTPAAHALLAQYVVSVIEAPEKVALLAEVPLQLAAAKRRAIEGRYLSENGPRAKGKFDVYAAYDYNPSEINRNAISPGNDNKGHTVTVGADLQLTGTLSAGMAFGYSWNKSDLDNNAGSFKLDAALLTAYGAFQVQRGYVAAAATFGDLDFKDVRRNIALGPLVRTESGETKGSLQAYTLTGGYILGTPNLGHGPVASVTYQKVHVNDYTENGANSTTMKFGQQERESLVTSLGYQLNAALPAGGTIVRPFVRIAYEHDSMNDDRTVRAGLVTMGGSFAMPVFHPGNNWTRLDLGVSAKLGPSVTGYVHYSGAFGQDDAKSNAVTLGVKIPL